MNWCPCTHDLPSFCGIHGAPTTTSTEQKLRRSRDRWRSYVEDLKKQVERLRYMRVEYTVDVSSVVLPGRVWMYMGEKVEDIWNDRRSLRLELDRAVKCSPMTASELVARNELALVKLERDQARRERDAYMAHYEAILRGAARCIV